MKISIPLIAGLSLFLYSNIIATPITLEVDHSNRDVRGLISHIQPINCPTETATYATPEIALNQLMGCTFLLKYKKQQGQSIQKLKTDSESLHRIQLVTNDGMYLYQILEQFSREKSNGALKIRLTEEPYDTWVREKTVVLDDNKIRKLYVIVVKPSEQETTVVQKEKQVGSKSHASSGFIKTFLHYFIH